MQSVKTDANNYYTPGFDTDTIWKLEIQIARRPSVAAALGKRNCVPRPSRFLLQSRGPRRAS